MKTTIAAALIAIAIGLLFSPLSRQYPIFHWLMYLEPALVGLLPALTPHPWGFTFEQLEQIDLTGQVALVTVMLTAHHLPFDNNKEPIAG
eukprot:scaffold69627_cov36-Cyclotella_meneghiniana.AAC.1